MKPIFHYKAWLVGVCFINAKSLDKEKNNLCFWKPSNFILFITFEPFHKLKATAYPFQVKIIIHLKDPNPVISMH